MQRALIPRLAVLAGSRPRARLVFTMAAAVQQPEAYDELCKKLRDLNALNGAACRSGPQWDSLQPSPRAETTQIA